MSKTYTVIEVYKRPLELLSVIFPTLIILTLVLAFYKLYRRNRLEDELLNSLEYQQSINAATVPSPDEPLFGSRALEARQYCDDITIPRHPNSSTSIACSSAASFRRRSQPSPEPTDSPAAMKPTKPTFLSRLVRSFITAFRGRPSLSEANDIELQAVTARDQSTNALLAYLDDTPDTLGVGAVPAVLDVDNIELFTRSSSDVRPQTSSTNQSFETTKSADTNASAPSGTDSSPFRDSVVTTAPTTPDEPIAEFREMEDHRLSHVAETGTFPPRRSVNDGFVVVVTDETGRSRRISSWGNGHPGSEKAMSPPLERSSLPAMPSLSSRATTTVPTIQEPRAARRNYAYHTLTSDTRFQDSFGSSGINVQNIDESTPPSKRLGWRHPNERYSVGNGFRLQLNEDVEWSAETHAEPSPHTRRSVFSRLSHAFR